MLVKLVQADFCQHGTGTVTDRTLRRSVCRCCLYVCTAFGRAGRKRTVYRLFLFRFFLPGIFAVPVFALPSNECVPAWISSACRTCGIRWSVQHYRGLLQCSGARDFGVRLFTDHLFCPVRISFVQPGAGFLECDRLSDDLCDGCSYVSL